jgi:hypothetical protein
MDALGILTRTLLGGSLSWQAKTAVGYWTNLMVEGGAIFMPEALALIFCLYSLDIQDKMMLNRSPNTIS